MEWDWSQTQIADVIRGRPVVVVFFSLPVLVLTFISDGEKETGATFLLKLMNKIQ